MENSVLNKGACERERGTDGVLVGVARSFLRIEIGWFPSATATVCTNFKDTASRVSHDNEKKRTSENRVYLHKNSHDSL